MKFEELFENNNTNDNDPRGEFYSPQDDNLGTRHYDDTHKTKLTLKKLNKLRHIRAARTVENLKRQKMFSVIYGNPKEDEGGGGPF